MTPPETETQGSPAAAPAEVGEFEALLNKEFKARDVQKQTAVQTAVRTLAQQALASTKLISADVTNTISAIIAEIDRKLSEQTNLIIHHTTSRRWKAPGEDFIIWSTIRKLTKF